MAANSLVVPSREAAFEAFRGEFSRNGCVAPESLFHLLERFSLKPGESPEAAGRARLYRRIWALLWFGSNQTLRAEVGRPTYVYPPVLKRVARELIPGQLIDSPDPTHARVYVVTIEDLAGAK